MNFQIMRVFVSIVFLLTIACGKSEEGKVVSKDTSVTTKKMIKNYEKIETVKYQIAKLAPVKITYDPEQLDENQKKALKLIVKAARYMDSIFLNQVYMNNETLKKELIKEKNPDYSILRDYFKINFGPFDRLKHNQAFINLDEIKPAGANFYPADMTKEEFEDYIKAHPEEEKLLTSEFTLVRRKEGKLISLPYSDAFRDLLEPSAKLLKEAALLIENPSLKKYLNSRADAFLSNDYYQSDIDWVLLKDHDIEMVIGPYEVYEDELFGYKAAFESFITLMDHEESKKMAVLGEYVLEMEKHLPIEDKYKNFNRGKSSPIVIVNEVYTSGDTKAGIQTTAFNLPNDERVRESTGSKKVMLKNIARAKFENCWIPIVKEVLDESDLPFISFDSYFNHVLMHEIAHGLGPGIITKDGNSTTVNKELKELYPTIEEAKADIVGLYCYQYMIEKGILSKDLQKNIYVTYLGGIFRSVRFGINAAHGGGNAIQMNYILEKEGFMINEKTGRFRVNQEKIRDAVTQLAHDLLMIEALGDYEKAKKMITKYKQISPPLKQALESVSHVPVDIRPIYEIEQQLD